MGLPLLYMPHKGFIPEKAVTHMAEQVSVVTTILDDIRKEDATTTATME